MALMQSRKLAPMANQIEQKGKLTMDLVVESLWRSKEYSTPAEEIASLVGTSVDMPTSRGFVPQIVGVGQMKLEAPPQYLGKRHPRVRVWLTQVERYMSLMHYAPTNWLHVIAMRVEGAMSSW